MSGHKALPPPKGYSTMEQLSIRLRYSKWMLYSLRRRGVFKVSLYVSPRRVYYHTATVAAQIEAWARKNAKRRTA